MNRILVCAIAVTACSVVHAGYAAVLSVGPGKAFATPCTAFAAASDGDSVEIDSSGNYAGDVCAVTKNQLKIRGVGATRAKIDAAGRNAQGKAIWVVQGADTTIENVEFTGATVPDANGAGIRQEGKNLTVRNCVFRDNQDGILAGDVTGSEIVIEGCEFDHNGAGDGYSHNLYINHVATLTFRYNYSHRAVVGHLLKSRAAENYILYNRFAGEADGTESYEIDCPNGGRTFVIGNIIEQGSLTENPAMLAYLAEGVHASNPSLELFVVNNTFVNHLGRGTFIQMGTAANVPALVQNNVFFGGGTACSQSSARLVTNLEGGAGCFVNDAGFDYRLVSGSACVDAGSDPGDSNGYSPAPSEQYVHPRASEARPVQPPLDLGAYEFSNAGSSSTGGTAASVAAGGKTALGGTNAATAGTGGRVNAAAPSTPEAGCSCRATPKGSLRSVVGAIGICALAIGLRRRRDRE